MALAPYLMPANTQTQWARLVIGTLVTTGVSEFVVSPGSRNTPLVAAIQACTQAHLTLVIDERAAAFVALGQARASGRAVALVCTSGTAPAHYLPALIEANYSNIPLVVLSADRPPEMQANGSPQTIDQQHLFGSHVRTFIDLGPPDARTAALRGVQRKIAQGVATTAYPLPGPVHFNFPARKPLEPIPALTDAERELCQQVDALLERGPCYFSPPLLCPARQLIERLAQSWSAARRPVLFLGPSLSTSSTQGIEAFCRRTHWPVFAEASHPLKFSKTLPAHQLCDQFELLLRTNRADLEPDLVVCVGGTATSRAWSDLLAREDGPQIYAIAPHHWMDSSNRARAMVAAEPDRVFEALINRVDVAPPEWVARCAQANNAAVRAVDALVADDPGRSEQAGGFTEAHALRQLSRHIGSNDTIILGNSLTIRLAETFLKPEVACRCVSQRGANGIDGLIAGSVGTSLGNPHRTWLILGDVSAVHDLGALRVVADIHPALTICLLDNDGGRLFDELPIAQLTVDLTPWTTPHRSDFVALGRAFGLLTHLATSRSELETALTASPSLATPKLVICKFAPSGARSIYPKLIRLTQKNLASALLATAGESDSDLR